MTRPLLWLLLLAVLVTPPLSALDRPVRAGDDGVNLQLTLTIVQNDGSADVERTVHALMLEDQRTRLTSGWRMPTAMGRDDEGQSAVQYQDVGLGVTLHGRRLNGGRIRLAGDVEISSVASSHGAAASASTPVVSTFFHRFEVVVDDGVPTHLARLPRLDGGSVSLTLTGEVEE